MKKQKGFSLIELLVVVAIIGILAAVGIVAFQGFTLAAKKRVAQENFRQITNFIVTEKMTCEVTDSEKIFVNHSCPITTSVAGSGSGWCGRFGDYFLKNAGFKNPFGGSAFGVGNSENDGITNCVLCNRSPYCSGSDTKGKYKFMWWYDGNVQDSMVIAPNE